MMIKRISVALLLGVTLCHAETIRLYSIGNSLTGPMRNPDFFPATMKNAGFNYEYGFHWRGGAGLKYMWNHPDDSSEKKVAVESFKSVFSQKTDYDYLLLEPFADTLGEDKVYAPRFIDLINASCGSPVVLIYAHWPRKIEAGPESEEKQLLDFSKLWQWESREIRHDGVDYSKKCHPEETRQHFDRLVRFLRRKYPNQKIELFPAAHAFYEFDRQAKAGKIPAYSGAYDLLHDNIHPNRVGAYIIACTLYSSLTGMSPVGLPYDNYFDSSKGNDELALLVQNLVLKVQRENAEVTGFPDNERANGDKL